MKNVSCEYDRWVVENSTLQAAFRKKNAAEQYTSLFGRFTPQRGGGAKVKFRVQVSPRFLGAEDKRVNFLEKSGGTHPTFRVVGARKGGRRLKVQVTPR